MIYYVHTHTKPEHCIPGPRPGTHEVVDPSPEWKLGAGFTVDVLLYHKRRLEKQKLYSVSSLPWDNLVLKWYKLDVKR